MNRLSPISALPIVSHPAPPDAPAVALQQFDELWFQLTGTLCNLTCKHCFISCSPSNRSFDFLPTARVIQILEQSRGFAVKEYYFTGGEPFMHPEILEILEATLRLGPATVLTNGTLFRPAVVQRLAAMRDASIYSLELRVSIDGPDAATNDPIRGEGTFDRAMAGVRALTAAGFLPIITMAQTWDDAETPRVFQSMRQYLIDLGYGRPRIKIIPSLRIGAEATRTRGYLPDERVTHGMLDGFDTGTLLCSRGRTVTDRGVHVCPILIESPDSILGADLADAAQKSFPLHHPACHTCWLYGAICSNAASSGSTKERAVAT